MPDDQLGWWRLLSAVSFDAPTHEILPRACDRFYEARYFAERAADTPCDLSRVSEVNWNLSAHVAAVLGIWDAARADCDSVGALDVFDQSAVHREFFLSAGMNTPADERDPVAINRAYGDLRNLRVHFGVQLVDAIECVLPLDVGTNRAQPRPRWFLLEVSPQDLSRLRRPRLDPESMVLFNRWVGTRPLADIVAQHLYVLSFSLPKTAIALRSN